MISLSANIFKKLIAVEDDRYKRKTKGRTRTRKTSRSLLLTENNKYYMQSCFSPNRKL